MLTELYGPNKEKHGKVKIYSAKERSSGRTALAVGIARMCRSLVFFVTGAFAYRAGDAALTFTKGDLKPKKTGNREFLELSNLLIDDAELIFTKGDLNAEKPINWGLLKLNDLAMMKLKRNVSLLTRGFTNMYGVLPSSAARHQHLVHPPHLIVRVKP